jgi:hypothetical protein
MAQQSSVPSASDSIPHAGVQSSVDCGAGTARASVVAEVALGARRAVEDEFSRRVEVVAAQVGVPALVVGRQPVGVTLGALRDQGDALASRASV